MTSNLELRAEIRKGNVRRVRELRQKPDPAPAPVPIPENVPEDVKEILRGETPDHPEALEAPEMDAGIPTEEADEE